jgi:hypothetical protein
MGKGADKLMWLDFIQIPMNDADAVIDIHQLGTFSTVAGLSASKKSTCIRWQPRIVPLLLDHDIWFDDTIYKNRTVSRVDDPGPSRVPETNIYPTPTMNSLCQLDPRWRRAFEASLQHPHSACSWRISLRVY